MDIVEKKELYQVVDKSDRRKFILSVFGRRELYIESTVYMLADRVVPDYASMSGYWEFATFGEGFGFMYPEYHKDTMHLRHPTLDKLLVELPVALAGLCITRQAIVVFLERNQERINDADADFLINLTGSLRDLGYDLAKELGCSTEIHKLMN